MIAVLGAEVVHRRRLGRPPLDIGADSTLPVEPDLPVIASLERSSAGRPRLLASEALARGRREPDPDVAGRRDRGCVGRSPRRAVAAAALHPGRCCVGGPRPSSGRPRPTLFFTRDGLEQASRPEVADHHAARFAAAGVRRVVDLGCGIGADALAFAGRRAGGGRRRPRPETPPRSPGQPRPAGPRCVVGDAEELAADAARRPGVGGVLRPGPADRPRSRAGGSRT